VHRRFQLNPNNYGAGDRKASEVVKDSESEKSLLEHAGEELFAFAVDREDVKTLLAMLPEEAGVERGRVEYELGILRIISVGWSISYFLDLSPQKNRLLEIYWNAVQEFSTNLSRTAGLMVGKDIDYFQILKDRLNRYVEAMRREPRAAEPAVVIGPEFAGACGNVNDVYTVMTGTKMFIATVGSVREYLQAIKLR
jgi:hypothetical protein